MNYSKKQKRASRFMMKNRNNFRLQPQYIHTGPSKSDLGAMASPIAVLAAMASTAASKLRRSGGSRGGDK